MFLLKKNKNQNDKKGHLKDKKRETKQNINFAQNLEPIRRNKRNNRTKYPTVQTERKSIINSVFDFSFNHDNRIFYTFILLVFIGVVSVYSSSIDFAYQYKGNGYYYLIKHIQMIGLGTFALAFFYFIRIEFISKIWYVFLLTSIGLLGYLFILASLGKAETVDGANRWIDLAGFSFQPSDFAKLSFVIFIGAFLSQKKPLYRDFKEYFKENLMPYGFWFFLILLLILLGKNLGTAMVVGFIGITSYGVSVSTKYHRRGFMLMLCIMAVGGVAFGLYESYRADRINVWKTYLKTNDTAMVDKNGILSRNGDSYQFDQVMTSIGSGGFNGKGLGESIGKFYFVKTTAGDDSIIGIIAEEWGFLVTSGIILLYLYLIYTCISVAKEFADKPIYFYLMIATSSWIGYQMFIHIGANIGLVPLTGQTLPFISLGGSSLLSLMCAMGLILNVSKQKKRNLENR